MLVRVGRGGGILFVGHKTRRGLSRQDTSREASPLRRHCTYASRGGRLRTFQFVLLLLAALSEALRAPTGSTPWPRLRGVLPRASSGWAGTIPSVPPERTQTAVTGRQGTRLFQTPKPVGAQTQPKPGSKIHPPK